MAYQFGSTLTLNDNFSGTMKRAISQQKRFKRDVKKNRDMMEAAFKRRNMDVETRAAQRNIRRAASAVTRFDNAFNEIRNAVAKPIVKVKDKASKALDNIKDKLKEFATNPFVITGGIGGAMFGAGKAMQMGGTMEQQELAMKHFIKVNNDGWGEKEAQEASQNFIAALRKNANETPFETGNVISAGTRAIAVAQGNIKEGMKLVKLAEDMAASNPEKTIQDAMEALADLKMGETERMKEFNFSIDSKQVQAAIASAGGNFTKALNNIKNEQGKSVQDIFGGLASKLADTGLGKVSTVLGKTKSIITDTGKDMLDGMKPALDGIISLLDRVQKPAAEFGKSIQSNMTRAINIFNSLRSKTNNNMGQISQSFQTLKSNMLLVWNNIKPVLTLFKASLIMLGKTGLKMLPTLQTLFNTFKPALNGIGKGLTLVSNQAMKVANTFQGWGFIADMIGTIGMAVVAYKGYVKLAQLATTSWIKVKKIWIGVTKLWTAVTEVQGIKTKILTAYQWALTTAMNANPVGVVIAGIVGLATAFTLAYKHSETFRNIVKATWNGVKAFGGFLVDVGMATLKGFGGMFKALGTIMRGAFVGTINFIKPVVVGGFGFIKNYFTTTFQIYKTIFTTYFGVMKTIVGGTVRTIKAIFTGDFGAIKGIISDTIIQIKNTVLTGFGSLPNGLKNFGTSIKDSLTSGFVSAWKRIQGIIDKIKSAKDKITFWKDDKKPDGSHSAGLRRVPHNNYRANLHKNERILNRREADNYDKVMSGKGQTINNNQESSKKEIKVIIESLVKQMIVREEADIDKIALALAKILEETSINLGGATT